jgi:hypothetical protein
VTDLAVLVPSRGRPANVARLIEACEKTCRADTVLRFGFDADDPELQANMAACTGRKGYGEIQDRLGLAAWTNRLAMTEAGMIFPPSHLASLGDDMVPVTDGWDERLIAACGPCGMAYPNDRRRDDIPEAVVMSTAIVTALGWMCEPSIGHWYTDNVWADLGRGAGCLAYLPDVVVEHRHPNVPGGDRPDATYHEAAAGYAADLAAYQKWRMTRMRADVATVREAVAACSPR